MNKTATSMTYQQAQSVVYHCGDARSFEVKGSSLPSAMRDAAASTITALLPTSDVVVFDGLAGIRSWSPPV